MSWGILAMEKDCDHRLERRTQGSLRQAPAPVPEKSCATPTHFLIANLELEFHVTPIRINELRFPNRKYFAIFRVGLECFSANPVPSTFLIETPRLKSLATPRKQRLSADSNRDRNGLFGPAFRSHSRMRGSRNFLRDSAPLWPSQSATSRVTLTLRAPQSNLPASCFVRALAGEHS